MTRSNYSVRLDDADAALAVELWGGEALSSIVRNALHEAVSARLSAWSTAHPYVDQVIDLGPQRLISRSSDSPQRYDERVQALTPELYRDLEAERPRS